MGQGCFECVSTAVEGYPSLTFAEVATQYHNASQFPGFKEGFDGARLIKVKLIAGEVVAPFIPPTEVYHQTLRSVSVMMEYGFCTESDIARMFKVSSSSLRLGKPLKVQIEDGSYLNGWLIKLRGLPLEEVFSLRRVKLELKRDMLLAEQNMDAGSQLGKEQPQELFELMAEKQVAKATGKALTAKNLVKLQTMESLQQRAQEVL